MNFVAKFKKWIRFTKLIWRNEPVRSWRRLENGKYMCDGDCGRWKLHGVCTCGLTHHFKWNSRTDLIQRGVLSWAREYQTEEVMMDIPAREHCFHGVHLTEKCNGCEELKIKIIEELFS